MTKVQRGARVALEARYSNAQQDEKRAREAHDQAGADRAKAEAVAAMDELYRLDEQTRTGSDEDTVSLVCPNPHANLVDAGGVTFVDGRAEGVPRSLARKYLQDFGGYTTEED
jgi:hypothetical protein